MRFSFAWFRALTPSGGIGGSRYKADESRSGLKPQRTGRNKLRPSWCPSAIREILHRELYVGRIVWNKKKYVKKPGTNKRVSRPRPAEQWRIFENPKLRIVPQELWDSVQRRIAIMNSTFGKGGRKGLMTRAAGGPHLLSGFLKCGECGNNLIIIKGRGGDPAQPKEYGCPYHHNRGVCSNDLLERLGAIEEHLLEGLQKALLHPGTIAYMMERLEAGLTSAAEEVSAEERSSWRRREELEGEIARLTAAIAAAGHSAALLQALQAKESELSALAPRQPKEKRLAIPRTEELSDFVVQQVSNLRVLFGHDLPRARAHLASHVREIRMIPTLEEGKRFYTAELDWEVLGREDVPQKRMDGFGAIEPVHSGNIAGGGFEPPTFGL